ncbi:hypothetical protein HYH02_001882 [Chlamydomonas schloesseri]|uniref:Uncharacterized protein n=1 Tax=Chlamydomonas schloesseri TaxID=2026947 RepID=A0A836BCC8_9CHLO|nr:hypothetical protein HYH02_001882 [Chlamydomonas schloesseri]|eukprot:KAG2453669.1 hypothetical protein HYH02_001882 [Chlamydomonas schloesseri]
MISASSAHRAATALGGWSVTSQPSALATLACHGLRNLLRPSRQSVHSGACSPAGGSHMSDNDPASLTYHKEKALKGETPAFVPKAEGWHETLASVSEAVVKAEQLVDVDTTKVPEKLEALQQHTIHVVQQLHHVGEAGVAAPQRDAERDVSESPAHKANLEHMRNTPTGHDPR